MPFIRSPIRNLFTVTLLQFYSAILYGQVGNPQLGGGSPNSAFAVNTSHTVTIQYSVPGLTLTDPLDGHPMNPSITVSNSACGVLQQWTLQPQGSISFQVVGGGYEVNVMMWTHDCIATFDAYLDGEQVGHVENTYSGCGVNRLGCQQTPWKVWGGLFCNNFSMAEEYNNIYPFPSFANKISVARGYTDCSTGDPLFLDTAPITFAILQGSEFGYLLAEDSTTGTTVQSVHRVWFIPSCPLIPSLDTTILIQASVAGLTRIISFVLNGEQPNQLSIQPTSTVVYRDNSTTTPPLVALPVTALFADGSETPCGATVDFSLNRTDYGHLVDAGGGGGLSQVLGVPYEVARSGAIRFMPDGLIPPLDTMFNVVVSASMGGYLPSSANITIQEPPYCLITTPDKPVCVPGDTVNFALLRRLHDGTTEPFPQSARFNIFTDGSNNGILLGTDGTTDLYELECSPQGFKFIVSDTISVDSVEVDLYITYSFYCSPLHYFYCDDTYQTPILVVKNVGLDHFAVTAEPDTIIHADPLPGLTTPKQRPVAPLSIGGLRSTSDLQAPSNAVIDANPLDVNGHPVALPLTTLLNITLDNIGSLLGVLQGPNSQTGSTVVASLGEVNSGAVTYLANGQEPTDQSRIATVLVTGGTPPASGSGHITVRGCGENLPSCGDGPALPSVELTIEGNNFGGINACEIAQENSAPGVSADGVFYPLYGGHNDSYLLPYDFVVCHDVQNKMLRFPISFHLAAIEALCPDNYGEKRPIRSVDELNGIGDPCCAFQDFIRQLSYGAALRPQAYILEELNRAHEHQHALDYSKSMSDNLQAFLEDYGKGININECFDVTKPANVQTVRDAIKDPLNRYLGKVQSEYNRLTGAGDQERELEYERATQDKVKYLVEKYRHALQQYAKCQCNDYP